MRVQGNDSLPGVRGQSPRKREDSWGEWIPPRPLNWAYVLRAAYRTSSALVRSSRHYGILDIAGEAALPGESKQLLPT